MSKIPSKRNRRNPLFVDLVNALEINIDFVHSIGDRFPELAESIKAVDPQELEEERRDLSLCVEDILRDPGFGDSLAQWVEAYLPPMIIVDGNYHVSFDLESRPSGPDKPTYIQEWIAWEIYTTFQKKTLYHLKRCSFCQKIFVAGNISAGYCTTECRRKCDYQKNRNKYHRDLKKRRRGQVYLPVRFMRCPGCRGQILICHPRSGKVITSKQLRCPKCGETTDNPHSYLSNRK